MPTSNSRQKLWNLNRHIREISRAFPEDEPQHRIAFDQPGDRILVLRYLYEVVQKKADLDLWARLNPKEFARLCEILPRKKADG